MGGSRRIGQRSCCNRRARAPLGLAWPFGGPTARVLANSSPLVAQGTIMDGGGGGSNDAKVFGQSMSGTFSPPYPEGRVNRSSEGCGNPLGRPSGPVIGRVQGLIRRAPGRGLLQAFRWFPTLASEKNPPGPGLAGFDVVPPANRSALFRGRPNRAVGGFLVDGRCWVFLA